MGRPRKITEGVSSMVSDLVEVEVLHAIGVDYTPEEIEKVKRNLRPDKRETFTAEGLTKMIYPKEDGPVFVRINREAARKLQAVGAVRVVI